MNHPNFQKTIAERPKSEWKAPELTSLSVMETHEELSPQDLLDMTS